MDDSDSSTSSISKPALGDERLDSSTSTISKPALGDERLGFIDVIDQAAGVGARRDEPAVSARANDYAMPALERTIEAARGRVRRALFDIGRELRQKRLTLGLSQRVVAAAAGMAQSELSMIERGLLPGVPIETLARIAAVIGLDLSVRLFPGGQPLRDQAHQNLLARFRKAVGELWQWGTEVPLPIPGDRRAWDRFIRGAGVSIGIEGETRPRDWQELARRLALKKRDGGADRLMLVLSDSVWNRRFVGANAAELEAAFPVPGRVALRALAEGRDPGGDAVILT